MNSNNLSFLTAQNASELLDQTNAFQSFIRDSKLIGRDSNAFNKMNNSSMMAGEDNSAPVMATISEDDDTEMWKQPTNENKSFISENI